MKQSVAHKLPKDIRERIKKLHARDRLYGTATVGERGQVVIPAEARKDLALKPGDQLVVAGNPDRKTLFLMKGNSLEQFIKMMLKHLSGSGMEDDARAYLEKMFGKLTTKKTITAKRT